MAKMNWSRQGTEYRQRRGAAEESLHSARNRNEARLKQTTNPGSAQSFVEALNAYTGTDSFLCDLKAQSRAYGPGWIPSPAQLRIGVRALAETQPGVADRLAADLANGRNRSRQDVVRKTGLQQEAAEAAEAVRQYRGTNQLLVSMRDQAERFGPGWVPSLKQLQCLSWPKLQAELARPGLQPVTP